VYRLFKLHRAKSRLFLILFGSIGTKRGNSNIALFVLQKWFNGSPLSSFNKTRWAKLLNRGIVIYKINRDGGPERREKKRSHA